MKPDTKRKLKTAVIFAAAGLIFVFAANFRVSAQQIINKVSFEPSGRNNSQLEKIEADEVPVKQTSENVKIIDKGIVNDIAVYLSQPVYPATAKAANARGDVNVEVLINAKGIVVEAKAVSGNSLLRKSAEWAARRTKFKPAKKGENPLFVRGIIIYSF